MGQCSESHGGEQRLGEAAILRGSRMLSRMGALVPAEVERSPRPCSGMWGWAPLLGASWPHQQGEEWHESGALCGTFHSTRSLREEAVPRQLCLTLVRGNGQAKQELGPLWTK